MKSKLFTFLLTLTFINTYGQRYLHPVFSTVNTTSNIVYGNALNYQHVNEMLQLDFYEPAGDTEIKRPLIIYMHGGGFTDVNQTKTLPHIVMFCDSFARRGYTVASINYRLDTSLSNRAIINAMYDARAAIRFFKANAATYKIDTAQIFMGGESAGAISSLNVNYIDKPSELLYPPVAPYSTDGTVEGNSGNPGYSSKTKATLCFCGGTKTAALDPVFDTTSMKSSDPPLLQLHGTSDPIIPVQYGLEVAIRANHVHIPSLFYPLYGATHCPWFYSLPNWSKYLDTLVQHTSTFLKAVVVTTGINEIEVRSKNGKVYPNPFSSSTILKVNENLNEASLMIYNSMGQLVKQIEHINGQTITLHRDNLPSGIYFIYLRDKTIFIAEKLVITD
jgi:acetyl esterase/lipase